MKNIIIKVENVEYEIIKNYKDAFNETDFINRYTSYFENYDFVVGDYAYGKLRLKGFYNDNNKLSSQINKISTLEKYIKENCAYGCKYFVAKKNIL